MPLILAQNEVSLSGHAYGDRTGISYEYPPRYRSVIQPGERFIYYMGRRRLTGSNAPQAYFGSGLIGRVQTSSSDPQLLECEILDYRPFAEHLYFKKTDGSYRESRAAEQGGYFRNGVRIVSEATFDEILVAAEALAPEDQIASGRISVNYVTAETRDEIERYSVDVAKRELITQFPGQSILEMPHNNPGYDICVGNPLNPTRFVEVKGTQRVDPVFFLTEGERLFSDTHAERYHLIVVHGIDLLARTHRVSFRDGSLKGLAELEVTQWRGRLPWQRPS
ncbi:DUF3883 domain-containing protein [Kineosporia sp. NBRC 101731]|uniref:protein NO VEIN domain-containing protein n=1 Tax=Kineosporia sp. NBRC 101731 TaxID=3032199 RepID=UPI002556E9F6|nr:DUF3883 domain-containing protein [Kineosporia sp. NBRC 101731]